MWLIAGCLRGIGGGGHAARIRFKGDDLSHTTRGSFVRSRAGMGAVEALIVRWVSTMREGSIVASDWARRQSSLTAWSCSAFPSARGAKNLAMANQRTSTIFFCYDQRSIR